MRDSPRYLSLALAVDFARDFDELTAPAQVVEYASAFNDFLTTDVAVPSTPPKPAAKPTPPKAADKTPPASEPKGDAETPAPKPDPKPTAEKASAKPEPEATAADTSKMVVKLVTKIGRDQAIAWMQKSFGSPNVSGLDTAKHSYASVIKKITAHIAELDKAAADSSPAE